MTRLLNLHDIVGNTGWVRKPHTTGTAYMIVEADDTGVKLSDGTKVTYKGLSEEWEMRNIQGKWGRCIQLQ